MPDPTRPAPLNRIAVLDDYQGVALELAPWDRLRPAETTVFHDTLHDPDAMAARLAPFDAVVLMRERTPFPRALIERLPHLRLLVTTGARNRSVDAAALAERGIAFCGTPSAGDGTVEIAWGLLLSLLRRLPAEERSLRQGHWQTGLGTGLDGSTLGVVGLGRLGSKVARIGLAFGMRVLAWSPNLTEARAAEVGAIRVDKDVLLREAEAITLHLVLSERSHHTIGVAELALMKPGAVLVNTSRDGLVDQAALVAALQERRIGGAGIDVYDVEPLRPDHPLLSAPNTVLTPHLGYVTRQNLTAYFTGAIAAIEAWSAGAPIHVLGAPAMA